MFAHENARIKQVFLKSALKIYNSGLTNGILHSKIIRYNRLLSVILIGLSVLASALPP